MSKRKKLRGLKNSMKMLIQNKLLMQLMPINSLHVRWGWVLLFGGLGACHQSSEQDALVRSANLLFLDKKYCQAADLYRKHDSLHSKLRAANIHRVSCPNFSIAIELFEFVIADGTNPEQCLDSRIAIHEIMERDAPTSGLPEISGIVKNALELKQEHVARKYQALKVRQFQEISEPDQALKAAQAYIEKFNIQKTPSTILLVVVRDQRNNKQYEQALNTLANTNRIDDLLLLEKSSILEEMHRDVEALEILKQVSQKKERQARVTQLKERMRQRAVTSHRPRRKKKNKKKR
jgi:hypothetical protein